jgi:hypothetical protein
VQLWSQASSCNLSENIDVPSERRPSQSLLSANRPPTPSSAPAASAKGRDTISSSSSSAGSPNLGKVWASHHADHVDEITASLYKAPFQAQPEPSQSSRYEQAGRPTSSSLGGTSGEGLSEMYCTPVSSMPRLPSEPAEASS